LTNKDNDNYLLNNKISLFHRINYQIKDDKIPLESGILYSYQLSASTSLNFYHK